MTCDYNEYGERCRFDAFCKVVLRHEAMNYFREMRRQRKRVCQFSALSRCEIEKLHKVDEYPSDSTIFTAYGYAMHIRNELLANVFACLPEREKEILILRYALGLPDGEIGRLLGMSRSAVQRHRTKALSRLRKNLEYRRVEA